MTWLAKAITMRRHWWRKRRKINYLGVAGGRQARGINKESIQGVASLFRAKVDTLLIWRMALGASMIPETILRGEWEDEYDRIFP
jgi:hypothetical protein